MHLLSTILFILFNIYLIESANRTDSVSEISDSAPDKSEKLEEVLYEEYGHDDDGKQENSISGKIDKLKISSAESEGSDDGFPNEVFLSLRNITADAATAFRSFTHRNDVADLQASASDNLNVTTNSNLADAESAGINLRALRDAGHPPMIIEDTLGAVHAPYKHAKIDTADLSDCALQGEWKPMGVAHGHLQVGGDHSQQAEILQSVGSYAVPNKVIPHWGLNQVAGEQISQVVAHKPFAGGGGHAYASGYGSGGFDGSNGGHSFLSGSGLGSGHAGNNGGHAHASGGGFGGNLGAEAEHAHSGLGSGSGNSGNSGGGYAYASGYGGHVGIESNHQNIGFSSGSPGQKIKHSMLSPPPVPPIIFGKKPGYWKIPKAKHKYMYSKYKRPSSGSYGFSSYVNHAPAHGGVLSQGGSGYRGISGVSSNLGHVGVGYANGGIQGNLGHIKYGYQGMSGGLNHGGGGVSNIASGDYGVKSVQGHRHAGAPAAMGLGHGIEMFLSGDHGTAGTVLSAQAAVEGATAGHLIGEHDSSVKVLSSGGNMESLGYAQESGENRLIPTATLGSGDEVSTHAAQPGNGGAAHIVTVNQGERVHPEAYVSNPPGTHIHDSTFSSTHITHAGNSQFLANGYLSNEDFGVHGQGAANGLPSSSTFTCGKNHDHNTNYHTATFQVADHDHPSSVDVLQYGGDATVLIQSGDTSFHDQILPERKHYKTAHLSDTEASGSDNSNELSSQTALASQTEENGAQTESELINTDDGEEPERHSYYHEITKVTKIPATSVGSIQKYYSQYETKPQTFTTDTEPTHEEEEEEVEQPQIIRELEHLSNKFQLDLENPQKLFEDPPNQELSYHYPFQEEQVGGKIEGVREGEQEGISEFPYKFYQNINQQPVVHHKRPPIKYIPRPGKITYEKPINYIHPKPVLVVRKQKPKQIFKKQNYEVVEHGGERHRPVGEIFPPQKFPKQFHNPKPNFAVDRPKKGWRPEYQEYKYDYSHGKKIRKFKTKAKVVAPIIIRRPVAPAPVLRVVEVSG